MADIPILIKNNKPLKKRIQEQLGAKAILLHENDKDREGENDCVGKPSIPLFCYINSNDGDRHFCIVPSSRLFYRLIVEEDLARRVIRDFPEDFGTNDPEDVIRALWKQYPNIDYVRFREIVEHEQYAWIVEYDNAGVVGDKYLRLDLFRHVANKNGKKDFQGGLLHVLKHFSYYGTPLSHEANKDDVSGIHYVLRTIIEAFFMKPLAEEIAKSKVNYISIVPHKDYKLKAVFYKNEAAGVYFVNTLHIIKEDNQ